MEEISWTDRELKECHRESRRIGIAYIQRRKKGQLDWSHAGRNCLLEYVIEEKIKGRIFFFPQVRHPRCVQ